MTDKEPQRTGTGEERTQAPPNSREGRLRAHARLVRAAVEGARVLYLEGYYAEADAVLQCIALVPVP